MVHEVGTGADEKTAELPAHNCGAPESTIATAFDFSCARFRTTSAPWDSFHSGQGWIRLDPIWIGFGKVLTPLMVRSNIATDCDSSFCSW